MISTAPERVLITGARAPVALHLTRLLADAHTQVFLADTYRHPLSAATRLHSGYVQLPAPRNDLVAYASALHKAVQERQIDLIIPTCEEVFYLAMLQEKGELSAPLFAPDFALLTKVHNKHQFIELAQGYGLSVPRTKLLQSAADLNAIEGDRADLVFKPVWSRFASQVKISPSRKDLQTISPSMETPWVAQEYIRGQEQSVYAIARNGTLIAHAIYRSLYRAGKGAGVCFAPVQDAATTDWVTRFVQVSEWDGQISFDMIRRPDGDVVAIECNPRATSGLHFFQNPDGFRKGIWNTCPVTPDVSGILGVRLAMWVYGLPAAVRAGSPRRFLRDLQQTQDILGWPDDRGPLRAQWRTLAEIAGIALRQRVPLQVASTRDIEWNGPTYNSIR